MSELPLNWVLAPIGDVTVDCAQRIPSGEEEFQYIDIASIDRVKKSITNPQRLLGRNAPSRARKQVCVGDVLVSMTRPILNAVALVPDNLDRQVASTGFDVLRAPDLDPRWLFYVVRTHSFVDRMSELVQGALYPAVKSKDVRGFKAPFAPLNEQKRIADKLDSVLMRVDSCRERLERIPPILKRFRQSVLAAATSGRLTEEWRSVHGISVGMQGFVFKDSDAFRDYEFPLFWQPVRLSDIAHIVGGITKDIKKQLSDYMEVPYLRVANVQRGFLDLTEVKKIRVPKQKLKELLLKPHDILFTEGGDIDKLGRGWVWNGEIKRCVFQNHVFRVRLTNSNYAPKWFSWYGNSRGFDYFLSRGKQTTNLASINKSILSALPVPIPPVEEQKEIVRRVEVLFAYADRIESDLSSARAKVERLTPALLSKAFRGKLVPQDARDEPARVLLERIRVARKTLTTKAKQVKIDKGAKMSRVTSESIREIIRQLPEQSFSFNDLRSRVSADYETLKDVVFGLLCEPQPKLKQVFDRKAQTMRFARVKQ